MRSKLRGAVSVRIIACQFKNPCWSEPANRVEWEKPLHCIIDYYVPKIETIVLQIKLYVLDSWACKSPKAAPNARGDGVTCL